MRWRRRYQKMVSGPKQVPLASVLKNPGQKKLLLLMSLWWKQILTSPAGFWLSEGQL